MMCTFRSLTSPGSTKPLFPKFQVPIQMGHFIAESKQKADGEVGSSDWSSCVVDFSLGIQALSSLAFSVKFCYNVNPAWINYGWIKNVCSKKNITKWYLPNSSQQRAQIKIQVLHRVVGTSYEIVLTGSMARGFLYIIHRPHCPSRFPSSKLTWMWKSHDS